MKPSTVKNLRRAADRGEPVSEETALDILLARPDEIPELLDAATAVRRRHFGDRLRLCSILNARSGACSEDCAFCAQSAHHETHAEVFGLLDADEIAAAYRKAAELPVSRFGVVTSGRALSDEDIEAIAATVRSTSDPRVAWCASLGCLDTSRLRLLKEAGVSRFHHNLETAESHFPKICSTHGYAQRMDTVRAVKEVGMEVCCGGILGLGESLEQRVEFAALLAREEVDCIPLNFLVPIPGTRLEARPPMKPLDMIRSIAMFRMMNPKAEVKVCAGRVRMGDLQAVIFYAGATGMMVGPLLTVAGRDVSRDLRMLEDLEFPVSALN